MSSTYHQLLDATIQHLEDLKSRGVRHVAVVARNPPRPGATAGEESQIRNPLSMERRAPPRRERNSRHKPSRCSALRQLRPHSASPAAEQTSLLALPGETVPSPAPPLDPQAKAAAFAALRERALACVKCPHLASSRKNVVFGVGSIDAQLMFVGEAPGADEDEQGEPFVGKAGQLLTKIIQATGLAARGRLHRATF